MITIWHNPRCSKSRQTLALIAASGLPHTIRRYLDDPPSKAELLAVLALLGCAPGNVIRKGETRFKDLKLQGGPDTALIAAMVENPILIERPIVMRGARAIIGRPPETVNALL